MNHRTRIVYGSNNKIKSTFCIPDVSKDPSYSNLPELINYQKTIPSEKNMFDVEKKRQRNVNLLAMVLIITRIGEKSRSVLIIINSGKNI